MVAQFAVENDLRAELRDHIYEVLRAEKPDLVAAHSLGTLVTYDFLRNDRRAQQVGGLAYLTFGSQINNVFVRSRVWPGRLTMPNVSSWTHLFNPDDHVFTADIALPDAPNFLSIRTPSPAGHATVRNADGPGYLDHPQTCRDAYPLLAQLRAAPVARQFRVSAAAVAKIAKPARRALLIGINDYPNPEDRLHGCVNDTFLMSAALQERGFDAENIRVLHNDRATASAIRERLDWLLKDVGDGMERVLFYSGHGAQLPGYNASERVDHVDECLVPYDFNWTKESAITDDDFYKLYSDLPFSAKFYAIFDCCHSGGMTRDGARRARGLTPPDDIRHRMLRWNKKQQMWEERELPAINDNYGGTEEERRAFMGSSGSTYRLGRGMKLRKHLTKAESKRLKTEKKALFLPVIVEACREQQLSYEYRYGTVSYGAFTYSMIKNLDQAPKSTFKQLIDATQKTLSALGYDQNPCLVGPKAVINAPVVGK